MSRDRRSFSLRRRILDRLCLFPSRHPLDCGRQQKFWLELDGRPLECFRQWQLAGTENPADEADWLHEQRPPIDLLIVKWAGNAGRAELSTRHPAQAWPDKCVEVWTINPPGYGGSPGRASLDHARPMAVAVWEYVQATIPQVPVLLIGNSIGSLTALHAATQAVRTQTASRLCGLLLRNPPPLIPLIKQHYARRYHLGAPAWLVGAWNTDWDSCRLAAACRCPLLLLQSQWDQVVPPRFQDLIYEAHPGPKLRFVLPRADHDEVPTPEHGQVYTDYRSAIRNHFPV